MTSKQHEIAQTLHPLTFASNRGIIFLFSEFSVSPLALSFIRL